ncbi:hypothetical protein [Spirulina sp. 06S082]|uniref:hypothetical protein n=1 Tax=Spirulina sp. 06S082 TaxID=3110248 RepID=UPI002B201541|nr:hypothetical protein [Spirulina sp. 06S082]MEA5472297.1 hypothetical protein [Spirulina sp. 06S082]
MDAIEQSNVNVVSREVKPNFTDLLGTWYNTNPQTENIAKVIINVENDEVMMQVFEAGNPNLSDWGKAKLQVFTTGITASIVYGFTTKYDRELMETVIAANCKKGVLVLQAYNTHKNSPDKFNYFSREFFHQSPSN